MSDSVELLAPAGNFETALAAFEAGADAVYCGLTEFSARAFADNFSLEDLKNLLRYAHGRAQTPAAPQSSRNAESFGPDCGAHGVRPLPRRVYVTFNTVIDEDNLEAAIEQLARLDEAKPDALIVQDIGVARICRKYFPGLELHASTQLVAHNLEGVLAMKDLGFKRVVLARELSLEEITSIAKRCGDMELEVFIHGALCYSISGLCLFGAMEKGRSGNRGKCPYCCRQQFDSSYPFSMKDLRLGEDVRKLADAGVASLKIEGRMKSALYVASVTRYYRDILNTEAQRHRGGVTVADLETVFSRRTTKLYFEGRPTNSQQLTANSSSPIDSESLGHLGAEIGVVKRVTKDREGLSWLRFHTSRGLEKHDGLQFEAMVDGKHVGMGVVEMRQAISRRPVFEVNAGVDVEVLLPQNANDRESGESTRNDLAKVLKPGMKIYCSMSNAVKRMFPTPSFRPSDYEGGTEIDVEVTLCADKMLATSFLSRKEGTEGAQGSVEVACRLEKAKNPEKTFEGVRKAFSKLGGSDYRLGKLTVVDSEKLFAPMSVLNDLRRDLVERLDEARERLRREKIVKACGENDVCANGQDARSTRRRVKIRMGQTIPSGAWDEVVVAINSSSDESQISNFRSHINLKSHGNSESQISDVRLALPVWTAEPEFNKLRSAVKRFLREGYEKWEASDLATLRMLKQLGVTDITADWTLYAFNSRALAELSEMGVKRFVASPENNRENLQYLAESGYDVEFLTQQSTPLFVSLTQPAAGRGGETHHSSDRFATASPVDIPPQLKELAVFQRDGLWVTTKRTPRTFETPEGVSTRLDLSWDPE